MAGDAQNDSHFPQIHRQRRSPIGEKRQRNAGGGKQIGHHPEIQDGLDGNEGHKPRCQDGGKPVPGPQGDPVTPQNGQAEQDDDAEGAYKTKLFTYNGEDVVVVLKWQISILLPGFAQPQAE